MRQVIFAVSLLGAFLAGMGFLSNWWTGRFETNYGPTIHLLTKVYGAAAVIFSAAALAMTMLAFRGNRAIARPARGSSHIGLAMIAFAWIYPHFLEGTVVRYLYAAPVGLIPCPTLALAIGFALLGGGLGARAWNVTLASVGLFYGLFGVLRLGVLPDVAHIVGATALFLSGYRIRLGNTSGPAALTAAR